MAESRLRPGAVYLDPGDKMSGFRESVITEDEARVIRERRLAQMREILEGHEAYRVLVTSSRTWTDRAKLYSALDDAERRAHLAGYSRVVVVHGGARGGDTMADDWTYLPPPLPGMTRGREPHALTDADWKPGGIFDPSAGFRRNAEMVLAGAHECIAAADRCVKRGCRVAQPHDSHGTSHCAVMAGQAGIHVERISQ